MKQMIFTAVHRFHTKPHRAYLLLQLCILTNGWSPKTELSRPVAGHFKGIQPARFMIWRLHKTWCFSSAFSNMTTWRPNFIAVWPKFIILFSFSNQLFQGLITQSKIFILLWKLKAPRQFYINVGQQGINRNNKEKTCMILVSFFGDSSHLYLEAAVFSCGSVGSFWSCPPTHGSHVNTVVCYELWFQLKVGGADLGPALINQSGAASHTINLTGVRGS